MTDKQNGVFMYTRSDGKMVNNNSTVGETYDRCKS